MEKVKILYISQEITPFNSSNPMSDLARRLPQAMHEKGNEIRVFMPRFGSINERRHQLHEVIRLSGMNLVINDSDHPLIIKVASIPSARMQVYFIDNEEFFKRKGVLVDGAGKYYKDNDERAIFFCKGVLETVKKLGWKPDIIHCHGWMTSLIPLFVKKLFNEDPHFEDSKLVYSLYNEGFPRTLDKKFMDKLSFEGLSKRDISAVEKPDYPAVNQLGFKFADAVIKADEKYSKELEVLFKKFKGPVMEYPGAEGFEDAYNNFYHEVFDDKSVLV